MNHFICVFELTGTWGHAAIGSSTAANEQLINYLFESIAFVLKIMDRWSDAMTYHEQHDAKMGGTNVSNGNNRMELNFVLEELIVRFFISRKIHSKVYVKELLLNGIKVNVEFIIDDMNPSRRVRQSYACRHVYHASYASRHIALRVAVVSCVAP